MEPIKILIADDHSMVREGLKQLLELDGDIKVIGEAGDGVNCYYMIQDIHPDVVLLDLDMPVMDGFELLKKMKSCDSNCKILVLTIHNDVEYVSAAMNKGALGYVLKDSDSRVLKKAIFSIMNNEKFIDPILVPYLKKKKYTKKVETEKVQTDSQLSYRELETLRFLAEGLNNKEISVEMKISERTVKNHISSIFKKINVSDRTQAALYAIKHNLVNFR